MRKLPRRDEQEPGIKTAIDGSILSDELYFRVLKVLDSDPRTTQRALAQQLGVSLGKTNYCLRALVQKGWVKARNFKNSRKKLAYAYLLTPAGAQQKAEMTVSFLRRKQREFEKLELEIRELRREIHEQAVQKSEQSRGGNG